MSQYQHLYPRLCKAWDHIITLVPHADLSNIEKLHIDTMDWDGHCSLDYDSKSCVITVHPRVFSHKVYSSAYLNRTIYGVCPLEATLLHELHHFLIWTSQDPKEPDFDLEVKNNTHAASKEEEQYIDLKVERILKGMSI